MALVDLAVWDLSLGAVLGCLGFVARSSQDCGHGDGARTSMAARNGGSMMVWAAGISRVGVCDEAGLCGPGGGVVRDE